MFYGDGPIRDLSDLKEKQPARIPRWFFHSCPPSLKTLWIEWPFSIDDILKEKEKRIFVQNKNWRIEKKGGMKMCYDFWRVKREEWQLSSDQRAWIDWKYGFGKISEHEFDQNF